MNRYAFYFVVSLLAFAVGITSFLVFYRQREIPNDLLPVEKIEVSKTTPTNSIIEQPISSDEEVCSGLDAEDYFEPAIAKWFKGQKVEEKPMRPPKEYRSEGDEYVPSLIDVNQDSKKELMIKGYCSPMKNCAFYIFEKNGCEYKRLFYSHHKIQSVSFGKSSHKGYREIKTTTKLNERTGFYSTYKYNGEYYETNNCFKYENGKKNLSPIECYLVEDEEN